MERLIAAAKSSASCRVSIVSASIDSRRIECAIQNWCGAVLLLLDVSVSYSSLAV